MDISEVKAKNAYYEKITAELEAKKQQTPFQEYFEYAERNGASFTEDFKNDFLMKEKKQIINAHIAGQKFASDNHNKDSEEYFNQIFKQS